MMCRLIFADVAQLAEHVLGKDEVVAQLRGARPGESKEETQKRGDREFSELQQSPFFKIWACAGVDEILSALHRRFVLGPSA